MKRWLHIVFCGTIVAPLLAILIVTAQAASLSPDNPYGTLYALAICTIPYALIYLAAFLGKKSWFQLCCMLLAVFMSSVITLFWALGGGFIVIMLSFYMWIPALLLLALTELIKVIAGFRDKLDEPIS